MRTTGWGQHHLPVEAFDGGLDLLAVVLKVGTRGIHQRVLTAADVGDRKDLE